MSAIKENRYSNLLLLIEEAGSVSRLEGRTGVTANYLRQIKNKNAIQNGKPKGIGDKIAAKLEDGMGKPRGWLDQDHAGDVSLPYELITTETTQKHIVINVLNVEASAGSGTASDLIEIVSQLRFVPEQFYEVYRGITPTTISVINVKGDSMLPTFAHGDLVFVDTTIQNFDGDGVYVFTFDNYTYIKRLQKAGRELRVLSDNKEAYPDPWFIKGDDLNHLFIHGKVKLHQSQKLNFIG